MGIQKKIHWYNGLNGLVVGLGALFPIAYAVIAFALPEDSRNELLTINPIAAIIAILAGFYGLLVYPKFHKEQPRNAVMIGYIMILAATAVQIATTGGVESPYLILWGILVIASGIIGWQAIALSALTTNVYWLLTAFDIVSIDLTNNRLILFIIFTQAPIIVALLVSMLTRSESSEKSFNALSDDLTIEQNKTGIVLEAIDDAVLVLDNTGVIEYMNPAGEHVTGWSSKNAMGLQYASVLILQLSDSLEQTASPIQQIYVDGKNSKSDKFSLISKNKREVGIDLSVSTLAPNTTQDGVVIVMRDITREKAIEKRRQDFIATASHEMRTPIAQIKGYLELLMNPKVIELDEKALDYVAKSHHATEHLGELFKNLLEVSKSDAGAQEDHPVAVNINKLIEELIQNHKLQAEPKGLNLYFEVVKDAAVAPDVYVYMDAQNLREVLDNLIGNSVKYTKEGFVKVMIASNKEVVQIDIVDSGIGIAQEDMQHLFQKFYRADSTDTREIGGTGLGLYLVKRIIERNKGKVWVDSAPGHGSTFHVQLPVLEYSKAKVLVDRQG